LATVWNHVFRSVVPFPVAPAGAVIHPLQSACTIAIAGDWGTGDEASRRIATEIDKLQATYTIHLGDVLLLGHRSRGDGPSPSALARGTIASFTLNSNHEMYSGGHGYFGVALTSEVFETQGPLQLLCSRQR